MKIQKLFLTSALCMCAITPTFADIASDAESATCESDVIGATSGSTTLDALWTAQEFNCSEGEYFDSANLRCDWCPSGSYCPNEATYTVESQSNGAISCSTVGDGSYTLTDGDGYSLDSDCYKECTTPCTQWSTPAHAATFTQNTNESTSGSLYYGSESCNAKDLMCSMTAFTCEAGYTPDYRFSNKITTNGSAYAAKRLSVGKDSTYGGATAATYGLTQAGEFGVTFPYGTVHGNAICSSTSGTQNRTGTPDTSGTGQYCWCNMDSYTMTGESTVYVASPSWVYGNDNGYASYCADICAFICASNVQGGSFFRSALFGSLGPQCSPNTISIDWDPKNGEATTTNQCTYGESVTLPATPSRAGYIFGGWKVRE